MSNLTNGTTQTRNFRRWTVEEDNRLLRQIEAYPQNLAKGFLIVSEELGRTPQAVQSHWYTVLSKKPEVWCFFTASSKHVSKNRKNGMGETSSPSIWRRLLNVLKNF